MGNMVRGAGWLSARDAVRGGVRGTEDVRSRPARGGGRWSRTGHRELMAKGPSRSLDAPVTFKSGVKGGKAESWSGRVKKASGLTEGLRLGRGSGARGELGGGK